jgi:hypothetical protein
VQGASDRFPLTTTVDALRDITNGLIMPIQYRGTAALAPVKDELGKIVHYSANRTLILDRMHMLITNHKLVMSGYTSLKETIIAHLTDMVRDEQPDIEAEWKKITGNDHFFHSMALNLLARRVCEHMFHVDKSEVATSSMIIGADQGIGTGQKPPPARQHREGRSVALNPVAILLPKGKGQKGGRSFPPGFNPRTPNISAPQFRDHLTDIFTSRQANDSRTLLETFVQQIRTSARRCTRI